METTASASAISPRPIWIAFSQTRRITSGAPPEVAAAVKVLADAQPDDPILIFDARTSETVELDLRGAVSDVLARLPAISDAAPVPDTKPQPVRTAGRPRLGVTAREVTLLPRHWEWLAAQPGGASVALRKLVEQAQRANRHADQVRQARESAYRFMNVMAGNADGFEEATRALFAGDLHRLGELAGNWPPDIREHAMALAAGSVGDVAPDPGP